MKPGAAQPVGNRLLTQDRDSPQNVPNAMQVSGKNVDIRGRVETSPPWPQGGYVTRPIGDHAYDVQQFTGYALAVNPVNGWQRGQMYRAVTPALHPNPIGLFMYDPTDVSTWDTPNR